MGNKNCEVGNKALKSKKKDPTNLFEACRTILFIVGGLAVRGESRSVAALLPLSLLTTVFWGDGRLSVCDFFVGSSNSKPDKVCNQVNHCKENRKYSNVNKDFCGGICG